MGCTAQFEVTSSTDDCQQDGDTDSGEADVRKLLSNQAGIFYTTIIESQCKPAGELTQNSKNDVNTEGQVEPVR